jgi:hypothetical protein
VSRPYRVASVSLFEGPASNGAECREQTIIRWHPRKVALKRARQPEDVRFVEDTIPALAWSARPALLSRALQHVFCRQFEAAMSDLNLWPETQRKE